MWDGMGSHMNDMGWGWFGLGSLHMLLFWVLLIAAVVVVVKLLSSPTTRVEPRSSRSGARQILEERYARGEINREELEEKLNVLNDKHGS